MIIGEINNLGGTVKIKKYLEKNIEYTFKFKCGFGFFWLSSFTEYLKSCLKNECYVSNVNEEGILKKYTYITIVPYKNLELNKFLEKLNKCIKNYRNGSLILKHLSPCEYEGIVKGEVLVIKENPVTLSSKSQKDKITEHKIAESKQMSISTLNLVSSKQETISKIGTLAVIAIIGFVAFNTIINKLSEKEQEKEQEK